MTLFWIGFTIILGRLIVEIPIRVADFRGTASTLIHTANVLVAIVLGLITYHEKRLMTLFLCLIIIVLLNTIGIKLWDVTYGFE